MITFLNGLGERTSADHAVGFVEHYSDGSVSSFQWIDLFEDSEHWITTDTGAHVLVGQGESVADAVSSHFQAVENTAIVKEYIGRYGTDKVTFDPKDKLLEMGVQSGIAPGPSTQNGFGQCTECAMRGFGKGEQVYVGSAVSVERLKDNMAWEKKHPGALAGSEAFPHAWNVNNGKIVDRSLGSTDAKEFAYFGRRVPDEAMKKIKTGDQLAQYVIKSRD